MIRAFSGSDSASASLAASSACFTQYSAEGTIQALRSLDYGRGGNGRREGGLIRLGNSVRVGALGRDGSQTRLPRAIQAARRCRLCCHPLKDGCAGRSSSAMRGIMRRERLT